MTAQFSLSFLNIFVIKIKTKTLKIYCVIYCVIKIKTKTLKIYCVLLYRYHRGISVCIPEQLNPLFSFGSNFDRFANLSEKTHPVFITYRIKEIMKLSLNAKKKKNHVIPKNTSVYKHKFSLYLRQVRIQYSHFTECSQWPSG